MCLDFEIKHEDESGKSFAQTYTFASHIPSILSQLLQGLLKQRKATKKLMESEADPVRKEILNKMQLAYKVVCNSAYGYCGSTAGSIWGPFFPVAAVTTLMGRSHIAATKAFIESSFQHAKLSAVQRPRVVYGDTDSVMIKWPDGTSLDDAFWLGEQAARDVTAFLRSELLKTQHQAKGFGRDPQEMVKVLELAHEKEMWPALMCAEKKNYAYRCWTPKTCDVASGHVTWKVKTDIKGLQCVRRDTVPYCSKLMLRILDFLLLERNAPRALEEVHSTLNDLVLHRVPLEDLVVSKSVASSYKVQQVHIEARRRMEARGEEIPPVGGRMPFIITAPTRGATLSLAERAEHPDFVQARGLKPDLPYYLKACFSALRKIYQSFDGEKLEAILNSMAGRASNQGVKRLLDSIESPLESVLETEGVKPKKKKEEKKTKSLF
jgi:DNA polymerase elongation subunit (family B)